MFSIFPCFVLFGIGLVVGTVATLSASNWVLAWVGIEVRLVSFIPIIVMSKGGRSAEAGAKYFLAQAMGSCIFLLGPVLSILDLFSSVVGGVIMLGLLVKVGRAPIHQ